MSDQIHQAPRAPQPIASPAHGEASHANFSRPTTATGNPQHAKNAHATVPTASTFPSQATHAPASAPVASEPHTLNDRLNAADRYWKFKSGLQIMAILVGLIGVGTLGWCMSTAPVLGYVYDYDSTWSLWPSLLTFSVSIIWCSACILVFVFRKRPAHPGLRVAIDLILWLAFIATALFALVSYSNVISWGEYGNLGSGYGWSNGYGDYEMASNGTWVWHMDGGGYSSYTRDCDSNSTGRSSESYQNESPFANCAELDAYVNQLWHEKSHRVSVELTGVVCQFIALVLHFALFVWACVDCHHHNRSKTSKDAEKIAANIVQTMITNGAIVPPPGQAHIRPMGPWGTPQMGYYQLSVQQQQQAYPMSNMYPQGMSPGQPHLQQGIAGAAGGMVPGPSNEKSAGPRYA